MGDTPKKKIYVSSMDAVEFRAKALEHLPLSEVWSFKYGHDIATGLCAMSCSVITYFFRRKLGLRPYAPITTYLPMAILPSFVVDAVQGGGISAEVMMGNCPTCVITKSVIYQLLLGTVYPLLMAPIVNFYLADRLMTYPVPALIHAPKEAFALYKKIVLPMKNPIAYCVGLQVIVIAFITQQKYKTLEKIVPPSK